LDEEFSRPLELLHSVAIVLLTRPAISGRLNGRRTNCLALGDVDSLGDYQEFSSVAEQGCASQALVRAMLQELFSGFSKRARTMPRDYTGILEQSLEHYLDLLVLNEGGPTSIRDLVMWCPDAPAH
jgi:hypothetical protein